MEPFCIPSSKQHKASRFSTSSPLACPKDLATERLGGSFQQSLPRGSRGLGGQTGRRLCSSPFHQVLGGPQVLSEWVPLQVLGLCWKTHLFALSTACRKWCRVPQGGCGRLAAGVWDSVSLCILRVEKVEALRPLQESLPPKASGAGFLSGTDQDANIFLLMMSSVTPAMPTFPC